LPLRRLLVSSEVALSTILLIAAGLLLHSFIQLLRVDKGFDEAKVIAADVSLPAIKYKEHHDRTKFYDRLRTKLAGLPGVKTAGLVSVLPLEGEGWGDIITVAGRAPVKISERPMGNYRFVSPGYFDAMRIPVLQGRTIRDEDRNRMPAVISNQVAKRVFPGQNPIGQRFRRADDSEVPFEIVGVVADINPVSLQQAPPLMVYVPYWFRTRTKLTVVASTSLNALAIAPALQSAIRDIDPDVPVAELRTLEQVVAKSISPRRFQMNLIVLFAITALVLASVGIYGVISYLVLQRRNEIGIRIALGAQAADVHRMILQQGLAPVIAGLIAGSAGALALNSVIRSLLFQVSALDPATYVTVCGLLLAVAIAACLIPSWRAARTDPAVVLRYE